MTMERIRLIALVLIVAGVLGLVFSRFTHTKETHGFNIGSLEVAVKDKETINIPMWVSVGALAAGAALLLTRRPGSSPACGGPVRPGRDGRRGGPHPGSGLRGRGPGSAASPPPSPCRGSIHRTRRDASRSRRRSPPSPAPPRR